MIVGIEGSVVKKEPTLLHVKIASGLVYEVRISLHCSAQIDSNNVFLKTTQIIKEDANTLFGFFSEAEKMLFDRVIKINGVGPSTALAICSTFTPEQFAGALSSADINAIKKVPGIGPKSAKRILVELSDFTLSELDNETFDNTKNEAMQALESLGFKKESVKKVLSSIDGNTTQEIIKEALKQLGR